MSRLHARERNHEAPKGSRAWRHLARSRRCRTAPLAPVQRQVGLNVSHARRSRARTASRCPPGTTGVAHARSIATSAARKELSATPGAFAGVRNVRYCAISTTVFRQAGESASAPCGRAPPQPGARAAARSSRRGTSSGCVAHYSRRRETRPTSRDLGFLAAEEKML